MHEKKTIEKAFNIGFRFILHLFLIERGWIWPENANEIKDFYDITEKCKINQYICYKRKHLYDVIKRLI